MSKYSGNLQKYLDDPRGVQELIEQALTLEDEDEAWECVKTLHVRATRPVFDATRELSRSDDPDRRELAAAILGQLGVPERKYAQECVDTLLAMLRREEEPDLIESIGVALGHQGSPRAVEPLARLKDHPDPQARYGVVWGLTGHRDPLALETLMTLMEDPDGEVRAQATLAIGSECEEDSPAIRAALAARLQDEDGRVRGEAIMGLQLREAEGVSMIIAEELQTQEEVSVLVLEAAEEAEDPALSPALAAFAARWEGQQGPEPEIARALRRAQAACRPR